MNLVITDQCQIIPILLLWQKNLEKRRLIQEQLLQLFSLLVFQALLVSLFN